MIRLLGLLFVLAVNQEAPSSPDGQASDRQILAHVKLEVWIARSTLGLGDLLPVKVRYTNASDAPLTMLLNPSLRCRAILHAEGPDGKRGRLSTLGAGKSSLPVKVELKPGEFTQSTGCYSMSYLHLGERELLKYREPQLGKWKIFATYELPSGSLQSNTVELTLKDVSEQVKGARIPAGTEAWQRFAMDGEITDGELAAFQEFVLSGPESAEKCMMAFQLGTRCFNQGKYRDGASMLRIALAPCDGSVDRVKAALSLAYCHLGLKECDAALTVTNQIEVDPQDVERKKMDQVKSEIVAQRQK